MTYDIDQLKPLSRLVRHWILTSSSQAGSGHPTSALSAVELMVGLMFGGTFRYDPERPDDPNNDRLIFSKGHATPLFYSLWAAAGAIDAGALDTYRAFGSPLEGHPTVSLPYVEAATGSLGQGLSIGVGMALNARRLDRLPYRTYVLLGDSEMAEGSQWEALQLAAHYGLDNLVGVLDVNRLGQRGETMCGRDLEAYRRRVEAFDWRVRVIDGHDLSQIGEAFEWATRQDGRPAMIVAETVKGKGVSFLEDRDGWHGKALDEEQLQQALVELGDVDYSLRANLSLPEARRPRRSEPAEIAMPDYEQGEFVATRDAYGHALKRIAPGFPHLVALDGEVSNSTRAAAFAEAYPERFFEMFIAEQNMVGAALGLARRDKLPFVSSFAAFLTRAFDQIRMAQYSDPNLKFCGSHAGVSIGPDGPSQMGLEDLAMFRTLLDAAVLYPCDAYSAERLVEAMAEYDGMAYLRTTRGKTPVIYSAEDEFPIGGCKVLRQSAADRVTVVAAGITVHEALKAWETLKDKSIPVRVIDLYSVKPLDRETLVEAAAATGAVVTVEDHYAEGGLGEAVAAALADRPTPVHILAVRKKPRSGKPAELLDYEEISSDAIARKVEELAGT